MLRKKVTGFVLSIIAILGLSLVALPAQASTKTTLKSFPTSLHRTWYHYDGHGRYDTIHFSSKKMSYAQYYDHKWYHSTSTLHYRNANTDPDKIKRHNSWVVGHTFHIGKANWTNVMGWNQSAGDGSSYKVETKTYHHKKVRVLSEGGGAEFWIDNHFYTSKGTAHKLGNHHFSGERYYQ